VRRLPCQASSSKGPHHELVNQVEDIGQTRWRTSAARTAATAPRGGSGGVIVLRAVGLAKLNADVTASPGIGSNAGDAGLGGLRYDLAARMSTPTMTAVKRAGATFDTAAGSRPLDRSPSRAC